MFTGKIDCTYSVNPLFLTTFSNEMKMKTYSFCEANDITKYSYKIKIHITLFLTK